MGIMEAIKENINQDHITTISIDNPLGKVIHVTPVSIHPYKRIGHTMY